MKHEVPRTIDRPLWKVAEIEGRRWKLAMQAIGLGLGGIAARIAALARPEPEKPIDCGILW